MQRRTISGVIVAAVVILGSVVAVDLYVRSLGERARTRVIRELSNRFDADVELKGLELSLLPQPTVVGEGLAIRHKAWNDRHPLIAIRRFTAESSFWNLFFQRDRVRRLDLEGLEIHIPPRGKSASAVEKKNDEEIESGQAGPDRSRLRIGLETLVADGTVLEIEPKEAGKKPLLFDIRKLTMHSVGPGEPLQFNATLENAKPPGLIVTQGRFGPWQKDDPRATAVSGKYTFRNADLSVFRGIRGILSSDGKYGGVLQHIEVAGNTDTPDFALARKGAPVDLKTTFHAIVNGANGDTILDPVDARFLNSEFLCGGGVIKEEGDKGKTVSLDAATKHGRIEDILQLVLGDEKPMLVGNVSFASKIVIPPGHEEVLDKLQLDGSFRLKSLRFTSPKAKRRLDTLSARARGIDKEEEKQQGLEDVASNLSARFRLDNGVATFSRLSFEVPGSQVKLAGNYNLRFERVAMVGIFRMQARLSATQSGVKHWLLVPFDPIFEKHGAGFEVPFRIDGTREHPDISVSALHHTFTIK
jgi:hypothetical protein